MEQENISAVLFPTYLSAPLYSGRDEEGVYHDPSAQPFLNNCRSLSPNLGIPEITVPIGTHSRGAGIGMEIAAGKQQEQLLLDIAYAYTLAYNHRQVPKGAPNLYPDSYEGCLGDLIWDHISTVEYISSQETASVSGSVNSDPFSDPPPTEPQTDMDDMREDTVPEEEITVSDEAELLSPAIRRNFLRVIGVILPFVILFIGFKKRKNGLLPMEEREK